MKWDKSVLPKLRVQSIIASPSYHHKKAIGTIQQCATERGRAGYGDREDAGRHLPGAGAGCDDGMLSVRYQSSHTFARRLQAALTHQIPVPEQARNHP